MEKISIAGSRVLVVDDELPNMEYLMSALETEFAVEKAESGEIALAKVEAFHPDLVLLDVMMPGMDGFEVCRRIKENPSSADIPVLFISSWEASENKLKGFAAGGVDYIPKPFEKNEVIARIRTHLELKMAKEKIARSNERLGVMLETRTRELMRKERQAAISLMIQGIVHNLRNPLAVVRFGAELIDVTVGDIGKKWYEGHMDEDGLGEEGGGSRPLMEMVDEIGETADQLMDALDKLDVMIDTMLARSKADTSTEVSVADLNDILEDEIKFLSSDLRFKNLIRKNMNLSGEPLPVKVVPSEVGQVFQNLVRNAMDAMWYQEDQVIWFQSGIDGVHAWFSVMDNGPGIPGDKIEGIFDPFFTTKPSVEKSCNGEPTGTGLGLHSSLGYVTAYRGRIIVENTPGGGAKFTVLLPCHGDSQQ